MTFGAEPDDGAPKEKGAQALEKLAAEVCAALWARAEAEEKARLQAEEDKKGWDL